MLRARLVVVWGWDFEGRKIPSIFGFHLGLELLDPLEAGKQKKRERKRELATSFCSSQRFLSLHAHKCTTRSSVFDLRAVVLVAAPFFPPSFLFPHAAEEIREKGVSKRNRGENESREKEGVGKKTSLVKVEKVAQASLD